MFWFFFSERLRIVSEWCLKFYAHCACAGMCFPFSGPFPSGKLYFGLCCFGFLFFTIFLTFSLLFFLVCSSVIPAKWLLNILELAPFSTSWPFFSLPLPPFFPFSPSFLYLSFTALIFLLCSQGEIFLRFYLLIPLLNIHTIISAVSPRMCSCFLNVLLLVLRLQCLFSEAISYKCVLKFFYSILSIVCLSEVIFCLLWSVFCDEVFLKYLVVFGHFMFKNEVLKNWKVCLWVRTCQLVVFTVGCAGTQPLDWWEEAQNVSSSGSFGPVSFFRDGIQWKCGHQNSGNLAEEEVEWFSQSGQTFPLSPDFAWGWESRASVDVLKAWNPRIREGRLMDALFGWGSIWLFLTQTLSCLIPHLTPYSSHYPFPLLLEAFQHFAAVICLLCSQLDSVVT